MSTRYLNDVHYIFSNKLDNYMYHCKCICQSLQLPLSSNNADADSSGEGRVTIDFKLLQRCGLIEKYVIRKSVHSTMHPPPPSSTASFSRLFTTTRRTALHVATTVSTSIEGMISEKVLCQQHSADCTCRYIVCSCTQYLFSVPLISCAI